MPLSGDKDQAAIDRQRYYRIVLPQVPEKPVVSTQPLVWTTMSHLVWDDYSPETLNSGQQRAAARLAPLRRATGHRLERRHVAGAAGGELPRTVPAGPVVRASNITAEAEEALEPLWRAFPPPLWPGEWQETLEQHGATKPRGRRDDPAALPDPRPDQDPPETTARPRRPHPRAGGDHNHRRPGGEPDRPGGREARRPGPHPGGRLPADRPVARRLARVRPLIRRVVLRRPEEDWTETDRKQKAYRFLSGPELSWFRLLGRDLGAHAIPTEASPGDTAMPDAPVAAWLDTTSEMPVLARKALEEASGISIPDHTFVLRVMLAYVICLVPINWLVCRYLVRRREVAWAVVPVLAFGFAIGVERLAAHDLGYDAACDEIDLLEYQEGYSRAHVNRFVALYSTGRVQQTIAYRTDATALALPLNMQRALPGEEVVESVFQSSPEPGLLGLPVQPRSLAMFRAEQVVPAVGDDPRPRPRGGTTEARERDRPRTTRRRRHRRRHRPRSSTSARSPKASVPLPTDDDPAEGRCPGGSWRRRRSRPGRRDEGW